MSVYEDEIDLRPYINAIRKNWWLIAVVTVLSAAAAFAFTYFSARTYDATATILLTRSRAALELAEQFPTVSEPIDTRSRMDAMIAIAGSDSLMMQALSDIHEENPENGIQREELNNAIEFTSSGDTIRVTATYTDPTYAAVIANAVAQNAVSAINYAYSGEQLPGEIQASLEPARLEYQEAQEDLESYLGQNQVALLEKQIQEENTLLDELVQDRSWQITYNLQRKQKLDQVIDQAGALKEQLRTNKASSAAALGDALAALRLHAEAFGTIPIDREVLAGSSFDSGENLTEQRTVVSSARQPDMIYDVQINQLLENLGSGQDYQSDIDKILALAVEQKDLVEANLMSLAQQSSEGEDSDLLITASERLRSLQSELEKEKALLNDLTSKRDISWQAYQALAQKETEVRNNLQTSSSVTLASPAVPPIEPASRGTVRNTIIGAAIGFFISITWILGRVWLSSLEEPVVTPPADN